MIARGVLRGVVVAIALLGIADPTFTRERSIAEPLTLVAVDQPAVQAASAFRRRVAREYDVRLRLPEDVSRTSACPATGGCVLVSSGAVPQRLTSGSTVIAALRAAPDSPRAIERVEGAPRASVQASSVIRVRLRRPVAQLDVFDDGVLVGSTSMRSAGDVEIAWTPIEAGARRLRVVADGEAVDVGVRVDQRRAVVWFYEPETTWLGTFVRRALSDDSRFDLRGRTQVAPPVAVRRGTGAELSGAGLADVEVVLVTAPHLLTHVQVDLLERFVTRRGGSLVLLPGQRPDGPVRRLMPAVVAERRASPAQSIGPLRASELLIFENGPGVGVLHDASGSPAIVAMATGRGRTIVSGALDAWRYRDAKGTFESFWSSLTWEAATAASHRVRLTVPALARLRDEVAVVAEPQLMDALPADVEAEGSYTCGAERGFLRLWPAAGPGVFSGRFRPTNEGACRVDVTVGGVSGTAEVRVATDVRLPDAADGRLDALVAAHGGLVVEAGHEDELVARIRERLPRRDEAVPTRPMRSVWWIVPFVLCLSAEWWLRRRDGLR